MEKLDLLVDMVSEFIVETYGNKPRVHYTPLNDEETMFEIRMIYKLSDTEHCYRDIVELDELENEFEATLSMMLKNMLAKLLFETTSDIENFVTYKYVTAEF